MKINRTTLICEIIATSPKGALTFDEIIFEAISMYPTLEKKSVKHAIYNAVVRKILTRSPYGDFIDVRSGVNITPRMVYRASESLIATRPPVREAIINGLIKTYPHTSSDVVVHCRLVEAGYDVSFGYVKTLLGQLFRDGSVDKVYRAIYRAK